MTPLKDKHFSSDQVINFTGFCNLWTLLLLFTPFFSFSQFKSGTGLIDSLYSQGFYKEAIQNYKQQEENQSWLNNLDDRAKGLLYHKIGNCFYNLDDTISALSYFYNSLFYLQNVADERVKFNEVLLLYANQLRFTKTGYNTVDREVWFVIDSVWNMKKDNCLARFKFEPGNCFQLPEYGKVIGYKIEGRDSFQVEATKGTIFPVELDAKYYIAKFKFSFSKNNFSVPRQGDMVQFHCQIPVNKTKSILSDLILSHCIFTDNYERNPVNFPLLFQSFNDTLNNYILTFYKNTLREIAENYKNSENPQLIAPLSDGLFKGLNLIQALNSADKKEISLFFEYVRNNYLNFRVKSYKFSEVFAYWAYINSPLTDEQLLNYGINSSIENSNHFFDLYKERLNTAKFFESAQYLIEVELQNGNITKVNSYLNQLMNIASHFEDTLMLAKYYYTKAKFYKATKNVKLGKDCYVTAGNFFKSKGHGTEAELCFKNSSSIENSQKIEVVVQAGITMPVQLEVSPDEKKFVTGGWETNLEIWDAKLGKTILNKIAHSESINSVHYSKSGKYIITSSKDGFVKIWDAENLNLLRSIETEFEQMDAIFSNDELFFAHAGYDGIITVRDFNTGDKLYEFKKHTKAITSLCWSADNKYILSSGGDSCVYVWNVSNQSIKHRYNCKGIAKYTTLSQDENYLAIVTNDSHMDIYNFEKEEFLYKIKTYQVVIGNSIFICKPYFTSNSRYIIYGNKNTLNVQDLRNKGRNLELPAKNEFINCISGGQGQTNFYTCGHDNKIEIFNLEGIDFDSKTIESKVLESYGDLINKLEFDSSGKKLGILTSNLSAIDLSNGKSINVMKYIEIYNNGHLFNNVGNQLQVLDKGDIHCIDASTAITNKIFSLNIKNSPKHYLTNNGDTIYYLSDFNIIGKDCKSGKTFLKIKVSNEPLNTFHCNLLLSADGKQIFFSSPNATLKVIDISSKRIIKEINTPNNNIKSLAISANGLWLATENKGELTIWDAKSHEIIKSIRNNNDSVESVFMQFSPHSNYLALSDFNYHVHIFQMPEGKLIYDLTDQKLWARALAFTPDEQIFASGGWDGKIHLYDMKTGKSSVTICPIQGRGFVLFTDSNYYLASREALKGVVYTYQGKAFPFEQFDLTFNRPDIVLGKGGLSSAETIAAYQNAYNKRLVQLGLKKSNVGEFDLHIPEVKIIDQKDIPAITDLSVIDLEANFSDARELLKTINVWVNNVPLYAANGLDIENNKTQEYYQKVKVRLTHGRNKIQFGCMNVSGSQSLKETIEVVYNGTEEKPDLYVIALSVSHYIDSNHNLNYARKDGRDICKLFATQLKDYNKVYIDSLFDEDATLNNFNQLKKKLSRTWPQDHIVLFISGHGLLDSKLNFYFATYDVNFNYPEFKGISYSSIDSTLDGIPSRNKLLLIDACHSGEVDKADIIEAEKTTNSETGKRSGIKSYVSKGAFLLDEESNKLGLGNSFELMQSLFTNINQGNGTIVISASAGIGYALESSNWKNGVFTYALINGMKYMKADFNKDQIISISELQKYVIMEVEAQTNGRQKPTSRQENFDNDYRVW